MKKVGELFSGLNARFMFNDRYAPVKKIEKKPFFRRNDLSAQGPKTILDALRK